MPFVGCARIDILRRACPSEVFQSESGIKGPVTIDQVNTREEGYDTTDIIRVRQRICMYAM